jgi:hypothetical protein
VHRLKFGKKAQNSNCVHSAVNQTLRTAAEWAGVYAARGVLRGAWGGGDAVRGAATLLDSGPKLCDAHTRCSSVLPRDGRLRGLSGANAARGGSVCRPTRSARSFCPNDVSLHFLPVFLFFFVHARHALHHREECHLLTKHLP